MTQLTQLTENEKRLFEALDFDNVTLTSLSPMRLWRMAVEQAFLGNWKGPHIDALRRGYQAIIYEDTFRNTLEFEGLIKF